MVTRSPIVEFDDADAGVDLAGRADSRAALEMHTGMDHGVGADRDVGVHVGRGRIHDRDAGGHQFFVLLSVSRFARLLPVPCGC